MVYTAEQQFISRAKNALEDGKTTFAARGKNKVIWEKMKQEFERQKAAATEPSAKRLKTSSSSSYSSSSSDDAEDVTPKVEEMNNEEDVTPMIEEVNDGEDVADVKKIVEGAETKQDSDASLALAFAPSKAEEERSKEEADKDENLTLAHKNDSFMSHWMKDILHYGHPRAAVEWSEHAQTTCNGETLAAILRVAKMLTELEGKDIEKCKEEVDIRQKYGADMNWARHFLLKFLDTEHAMTIHEFVSPTPLLCTVRLNDSSV